MVRDVRVGTMAKRRRELDVLMSGRGVVKGVWLDNDVFVGLEVPVIN